MFSIAQGNTLGEKASNDDALKGQKYCKVNAERQIDLNVMLHRSLPYVKVLHIL